MPQCKLECGEKKAQKKMLQQNLRFSAHAAAHIAQRGLHTQMGLNPSTKNIRFSTSTENMSLYKVFRMYQTKKTCTKMEHCERTFAKLPKACQWVERAGAVFGVY